MYAKTSYGVTAEGKNVVSLHPPRTYKTLTLSPTNGQAQRVFGSLMHNAFRQVPNPTLEEADDNNTLQSARTHSTQREMESYHHRHRNDDGQQQQQQQLNHTSPTPFTNSLRRPKSPRHPRPAGAGGGFLAAEHFHTAYSTDDAMKPKTPQTPKNTQRRRNRESIGSFQLNQLVACSPKDRRRQEQQQASEHSFLPVSRTTTGRSSSYFSGVRTPPRSGLSKLGSRSAFSAPSEPRSLLLDGDGQVLEWGNSHTPTRNHMRGCLAETGRKRMAIQTCTADVFTMYREECKDLRRRQDYRGDDSEFFMDAAELRRRHSLEDTGSTSTMSTSDERNSSSSETAPAPDDELNKSFRSAPVVVSTDPAEVMRRKSMRYPQAALVSNPLDDDPSILEHYAEVRVDNDDDEDTTGSSALLPPPPDEEETPVQLREVRLQLFRRRETDRVVPKARLARALNELVIQDGTIGALQVELEEAHGDLDRSKKALEEREQTSLQQQQTVVELRSQLDREKTSLSEKLKQESTENTKLHARICHLQTETSRLKDELRHSKTELNRTTRLWMLAKRGKEDDTVSTKQSSDAEAVSGELTRTALVTSLRAEIVDLKSQLANERALRDELASMHSTPGKDVTTNDVKIAELQSRLAQMEEALQTAKENDRKKTRRATEVERRMRTALSQTRKELASSKEKQEQLRREIEETRKSLRTAQLARKNDRMGSVGEVHELRKQLEQTEKQAEAAQQKALKELEDCRREAEELRLQVRTLTESLSDAREKTETEAKERARERETYEEKLKGHQHTELSLRERVDALQKQVAEMDAAQPDEQTAATTLGENDSKDKEKLSGEVENLKALLEATRQKALYEQQQAEALIRSAKVDEARKGVELKKLQVKLRSMTSRVDANEQMQRHMDYLQSSLDKANSEVDRVKKEAAEEAQRNEAKTMKLRGELALQTAKLVSARSGGFNHPDDSENDRPELPSAYTEQSTLDFSLLTSSVGNNGMLSPMESPDRPTGPSLVITPTGKDNSFDASTLSPDTYLTPERPNHSLNMSLSQSLSPPTPIREREGDVFSDIEDDDNSSVSSSSYDDESRPERQFDIAEFKKRLKESSSRLSEARSRLKNLVDLSDGVQREQDKAREKCDELVSIVHKHQPQHQPPQEEDSATLGTIQQQQQQQQQQQRDKDVTPSNSPSSSSRPRGTPVMARYRNYRSATTSTPKLNPTGDVIRIAPSEDWSDERSI